MNEKQQFAEVAKGFCEWVEADRHDLAKCRVLLLELLLKVMPLGKYFGPEDSGKDYLRISDADWKLRCVGLRDLPFQYYNSVTPHDNLGEAEPTVGDLCDDLVDIYADLVQGLQAWQANDEVEAVWFWYSSYLCHWGSHASEAAYAVDEYLREPIKL